MIRFLILFFSFYFVFSFSAMAEETNQRYQFNASRRLVFDTQTGKAYQFFKEAGDIKHIEIDYIQGTIKVNKTLSFKDSQYLQENAIVVFNQTQYQQ